MFTTPLKIISFVCKFVPLSVTTTQLKNPIYKTIENRWKLNFLYSPHDNVGGCFEIVTITQSWFVGEDKKGTLSNKKYNVRGEFKNKCHRSIKN